MSCLQLSCHGGKCCGVKTIHGFPKGPNSICYALGAPEKKPDSGVPDSVGSFDCCNPGQSFYFDKVPTEKGWQRLDRYLAYLRQYRKNGVVEVYLTSPSEHWVYEYMRKERDQVSRWKRTLTKRGFKEINKCLNSNSHNYVHLFVLNMGEEAIKKGKK